MDKAIEKAISIYVAERKKLMSSCETLGVKIRRNREIIATNLVENQKLLDEITALQEQFSTEKGMAEKLSGKLEALEEFGKKLAEGV